MPPLSVYIINSLGAPRDHQAIFVETNDDKSGTIFQVSGNIQQGMKYSHKQAKAPETSPTFISKAYIGTVSEANYPRIQPVVETIPPPCKQFHGAMRLYPTEPLKRCQEWTAEAVEALKREGILEE